MQLGNVEEGVVLSRRMVGATLPLHVWPGPGRCGCPQGCSNITMFTTVIMGIIIVYLLHAGYWARDFT